MTQVRDHCLAPARTGGAPLAGSRYTRLFPELPTLAIEPQAAAGHRPGRRAQRRHRPGPFRGSRGRGRAAGVRPVPGP